MQPHGLLRLLSWVYAAIARMKRQHANPVRVGVPVVSIGNVTVGGTGKTPITASLARYLVQQGQRVVILSRGYGAKRPQTSALAEHPDYGDEAFWLAQVTGCPVLVGANRVRNAQRAIQGLNPTMLLLDDGFQHVGLHRDLDIVLIDGQRGFGNGHCLPAGPLREPLEALSASHVQLITKTQQLAAQCANPVFVPFRGPMVRPAEGNPDDWQTPQDFPFKFVLLLSGIANPADFETQMTEHFGNSLIEHWDYADHQTYTAKHGQKLLQWLDTYPGGVILTTEKDCVKLQTLPQWEAMGHRVFVSGMFPQVDWERVLAPWKHLWA